MRARPIARKTLLFASSACRATCGGGNEGAEDSAAGDGEGATAGSIGLGVGIGLTRRGAGGGTSGDWRRRTEGLMAEFDRVRVSYWCLAGACCTGEGRMGVNMGGGSDH